MKRLVYWRYRYIKIISIKQLVDYRTNPAYPGYSCQILSTSSERNIQNNGRKLTFYRGFIFQFVLRLCLRSTLRLLSFLLLFMPNRYFKARLWHPFQLLLTVVSAMHSCGKNHTCTTYRVVIYNHTTKNSPWRHLYTQYDIWVMSNVHRCIF